MNVGELNSLFSSQELLNVPWYLPTECEFDVPVSDV